MKKFWSWLKRHTILYHLAMIALLFLGLAVAAFVAMAFGTRHSARRTVPDFVGLQLNDAEYFAGRRDLEIIVNDSLHVAAYPGGVVLDQLPKGGVVVKPGRKVYVTINSSRQRMVNVPYVAGRSLRQAKNMLETSGLTIDYLEYAEDIATNYVLAEFINGEEVLEESELQAEMGSGVVLRVGVSATDTATATPQVLGRSLFEAKSRLWESGLNIGEIIFDEGMPALERNRAKVYRQSLSHNAVAELGSTVDLWLTLDAETVDKSSKASDKAAHELEEQRLEAEAAMRDSIEQAEALSRTQVQEAWESSKAAAQSVTETDEDEFF